MKKLSMMGLALALTSTTLFCQMKQGAPATRPVAPPPVTMTEPPLESAKRIDRDKAITMVKEKKAIFVDVRPKEAYDAGHIKGSINIPEFDIITRIKELPKNKLIITYCA